MNNRTDGLRIPLILVLGIMIAVMLGSTAHADEWKMTDGKIYYMVEKANGRTVKSKGLTEINGKTYYFNTKGVMQTGFVKIDKAVYYFKPSGVMGRTLGKMLTGWKTINGRKFYFNPETGKMATGLKTVGNYTYFFSISSKLGRRGMILTSRTRTYKGKTYYLNAKGHMVRNKWVDGHYYGSDGVMLVSTATPDGWLVDENGEKVQELADGDEVKVNGTVYYWSAESKTLKPNARVLVVAGHGQGDPGAYSSLGYEYLKTREFASLICKYLGKSDRVEVTYYMDGSTGYDLYQRNKALLSYSSVTGSGAHKDSLISQMSANSSQIPVISDYDYVLEVHFNATGTASKDVSGNGSYKGISYYVNAYRAQSDTFTIEKNTLAQIKALGFKIWGSGIHSSSSLLNARLCQEVGTDYALIETAFIDDKDDMTFYNTNKKKMAKAVAACIIDYYS